MNKGLPPKLKEAFPNITPVVRPRFTTAEGCFLVRIIDKPDAKPQVRLEFKLIQHIRDEQFIRSLVDYLNYGKIYIDERSVVFIVTKFSDINEKLIPFFGKYPIQGIKQLNYLDFVKVNLILLDFKLICIKMI
ncbi:putative intron-encoded endonuclease 3 (mitochondrion) [Ceratocystis fimbriata CBS 114723]|uniref:Putative intron-encoded endonuclease 3 n=1 Tax=Ceratocystis fimbriata CBS 114723 TaxID=1035309 RepID=A0A2C5WTA3_9PEZI|nr:putative intron-encoded endonuclease 3 [Ceratocystis fimbriata CBS 114723]